MWPHGNPIRAFRALSRPLVTTAALVAIDGAVPAGASDYNVKGRWEWVTASKWDSVSGSNLVKGGGTHMALLRGASDEHWVLHWHEGKQARLWRPTSATDVDGVAADVPFPYFETFCSGHATLGNGKLLVVGGTIGVTTGERRCVTFDPEQYTLESKGWTQVTSSAVGHWYPTVTTLGDGKVLAVAGAQHESVVMFGGVAGSSDTVTNEARFLNMAEDENWNLDPTTTGRPAKRQGHSTVYWNGFAVVFGGEGMNNHIHKLWGPDQDPGRRRQWESALTPASPPPARSWHSAVVLGDTMYIFGGKDSATANARNDLWWINLKNPSTWNQVSVAGTWPDVRWSHTAVLVKEDRAQPVMVVYGGRKNATEHADDDVWELTIPRSGSGGASSFAWRRLQNLTDRPGPLEGHSAVMVALGYPNPRTHRRCSVDGSQMQVARPSSQTSSGS
jgi:Kelch motif